MKKKFLVIGVGRFGQAVIKGLARGGQQVVACDRNESCLDEVDPFIEHSLIGDTSDERFYEDVDITDFDTIIVSIGDDTLSCLLTVGHLKEKGAHYIISKANKESDARLLEKLGADQVILPEAESGFHLAKQLSNPGFSEIIDLSPEHSGVELKVPASFIGKSLFELEFRNKYHLTVVTLKKETTNEQILSLSPLYKFEENDVIFIVGENKNLQRFRNKFFP